MGQALYRKYRSKSLAEIVGQEHITNVLAQALAKNRIGHAFLFTGPKGIGKTSIARILAHEVNQLPYTDEANHLDIIEIDAASNRRIDDIRDLREKVHIAPTSAAYKVYIIDEVHMLTGESFNALLKTLEEPPSHVIFILATTEIHKLPATIISRTQRFHFRPVSEEKVVAHLRHIAQAEGLKIDDDALQLIAQHGEGSFRDSISLLDQLGSLAGEDAISATLVEATLGLAPLAKVEALHAAITAHDHSAIIAQLSELETLGVSPVVLASQLMTQLRHDPQGQHFALIDKLLEVPRSSNPRIKLLTTLALHATPAQKPAKTIAASTTPLPTVSISVPEKKSTISAKPEQSPTPAATIPASIEWEKVLEAIRSRHVALYSVLKHGKTEYENGVLTIYFAYDLHRKKLDNSKYNSQLIAYLQELYGTAPQVVAKVGIPAPKDATAAAVAEVMGGGEEVKV